MNEHPFLDTSFHIKWSTLTPDHIEADIERGIQVAQANIDAIAKLPLESCCYQNVFEAIEKASDVLDRAWGLVGHLDSVMNNPELRQAHNKVIPKVTHFYSHITFNEELWKRIKAAAERSATENLTPIQKRYVEETVKDFQEAGADLPEAKKKRLETIQQKLSELTQKYSENCLDSLNAYELIIDDETKLAGLPETLKEAARLDALKKGYGSDESPKWRLTLQAPSMIPVLRYLDDPKIRKTIFEAYVQVGREGKFDNRQLVKEILKLRQEKATLLGKAHFADLTTSRRMAKSGQAALNFTTEMHDKIEAAFKKECTELNEFYQAQNPNAEKGKLMEAWEIAYWSEKLRRSSYDFDEEALRPYFSIDRVINGMFKICETLFGIRIQKQSPENKPDVWHPEVEFYEIHDADNQRHLGSFYTDWHPRESKRGGAWMNYLITGKPDSNGVNSPHLGLMCGNLMPPVGDKPALLLHSEVETIFHEFGHLLHHLLGEVSIPSFNGVNVAWDFVELPSQIMENWCWDRESLNLFARHYETNEPIPDELFEKMIAARNFGAARFAMRQLAFGKMDLELHMDTPQEEDLDERIDAMISDYLIPVAKKYPSNVCNFGHLFSESTGYAAGYYSYKWAEVLDADAFTRFQREGVLNPETGRAFRREILSKGNSEDPGILFKNFMGRDPDPNALLKRQGLLALNESKVGTRGTGNGFSY